MLAPPSSCLCALIVVLGSATSWAGQGPIGEQQTVEQEPQEEKSGFVIFALTPLPEPDPRALALEGRLIVDPERAHVAGNLSTRVYFPRGRKRRAKGEQQ